MALRRFGYHLASQSRAATRSRVPTAITKAHKFSASQVAVFPNVLKSQETIEPMIPGRAAAALPAKLARVRPRACRCFFTHSFKPLVRFCLGAGTGALPPPPVSASISVEIAMPIAVRIDAMVIPCSRNRVRMRSASVVSSWRSRLNVSRILLIWEQRVALFVERASSLACLSSSMSESTLSSFLIRSRISLFISVSSVRQFSVLPGEVSFDLGFSVVDTRQLCQVVCQLISHSRHCLFEPSQLSSGLGDPHGVDWLIINRRLNLFCALTCAVGYAGEVLEFDVIKVARKGFIRLLECFHSGATQTFPRVTSESQRSPQCICTTHPDPDHEEGRGDRRFEHLSFCRHGCTTQY